jgi:hypothetical protein
VERSASPNIERMLNVFDLHLSTPGEKAVSRIRSSKTRRILQTLAGAYNSNSHARGLHYLTFVCGKQSMENQYNRASRFKEKCLRKAQHYQSSLKEEKALCKLNSLILPPKNHNLFCEIGSKRGMGEGGEFVTTSKAGQSLF